MASIHRSESSEIVVYAEKNYSGYASVVLLTPDFVGESLGYEMEATELSGSLPVCDPVRNDEVVLVSIVIQAFNADASIGAAIASVQTQSERRLEVLVVDDGSTEKTGEIVRAAAASDERVRYVQTLAGSGPGASRNQALALARGRWIALLKADDRFHVCRLERLIALGERTGAHIVSDNLLLCHGSGTPDKLLIPHEQLAEEMQLSAAAFIEGSIADGRSPLCNYGLMQPVFRRAFLTQQLRSSTTKGTGSRTSSCSALSVWRRAQNGG